MSWGEYQIPTDQDYIANWNAAIIAVCNLIEDRTPNIEDYTPKQLAERIAECLLLDYKGDIF